MKIHFLLLALIFLTLAKDPVSVTVVVTAEDEDEEGEYVQISMDVQKQDESLTFALLEASKVVTKIAAAVTGYCERNGGKGKCKNAVDVSSYEIQAKYQTQKREDTFQAFVAKYEITAKVFATENIGQLVDELIRLEVYKINGFEWKAGEEKSDQEIAVNNAMDQAESLCGAFGNKVADVTSIQQVEPEQPDQEEEEDPEIKYKVTLTCEPKAETKKK